MEVFPKLVKVDWQNYYRIIPSTFPTINFFEDLVDSNEMEAAWYLESLTNDRLRDQAGIITFVRSEDRICGKGSSVIMAAFTHIGRSSRFSDGSYGVFYAANSLATAVKETIYHRELFMQATNEMPGDITMRVYKGHVIKEFYDIRDKLYQAFHNPNSYAESQPFGKKLREQSAWGVVYPSVRDESGECIAALRPPAVSIPVQTKHLSYHWNGSKIDLVYEKSQMALS